MFVSPMLLQKAEHPFDDDSFLTELKLDGIRLILSKNNNQISLYTRHHNEVTAKFPELQKLDLPDGTVLDGEIVVTDDQGKPDFEAMMERFQSRNSSRQIQFCVFDILYHRGNRVTHLPLIERKEMLENIIRDDQHVAKVKWMLGNGNAYFELVKQHSLEGIVLKRAASKYQTDTRSHDWLKVIHYQYQDVYITGIRKKEFGWLLGIEDHQRIRPAGVMEFVPAAARKLFYQHYRDLIVEEDKHFIHIEPKIKCRVKFRHFTKRGMLRIPSFVEYLS